MSNFTNISLELIELTWSATTITALVVAILLVLLVFHIGTSWWLRRYASTREHIDLKVFSGARRAFLLVFWWLTILVISGLLNTHLLQSMIEWFVVFVDNTLIAVIAWFILQLISVLVATLVSPRRSRLSWDVNTAEVLSKVLKVIVLISVMLIYMQKFGLSISGLLTFGGVGGIALGFAAKDMLANFFGGLMIYLDRQFVVGDWIRSPDKSIEGTVEKIGWRVTCIRTFDMRPLYVPNATFTNISVENPSRMSNRRFYETFGLRYEDQDKVEAITNDVRQMLLNHTEIDTQQTLMVNLNTFSSHSVDFFVYTFTKTTNWTKFHTIKQELLSHIADIVASHGAEFAYPTQSLHIQQLSHASSSTSAGHDVSGQQVEAQKIETPRIMTHDKDSNA